MPQNYLTSIVSTDGLNNITLSPIDPIVAMDKNGAGGKFKG